MYNSNDHTTKNLRGNSMGNLHENREGCQDRVFSDQMVLVIVRQGGWTARSGGQQTLKAKLNLMGDYQA